jgi:hypothetical protein
MATATESAAPPPADFAGWGAEGHEHDPVAADLRAQAEGTAREDPNSAGAPSASAAGDSKPPTRCV